jgi:hypothetical protein
MNSGYARHKEYALDIPGASDYSLNHPGRQKSDDVGGGVPDRWVDGTSEWKEGTT